MEVKNIVIISFAWAVVAIMISTFAFLKAPMNSGNTSLATRQAARNAQHTDAKTKDNSPTEQIVSSVCVESLEYPCSMPENTTRPVVRITP